MQKKLKNVWNPSIWVLIREYLARAIQWIPTWQGLDGFQRSLHPCALNESGLSNVRVKLRNYSAVPAPSYLREMLREYVPPWTLRSPSKNLLCEPKTNMKTYGDRSFSACASKLWNQLPIISGQLGVWQSSNDNWKHICSKISIYQITIWIILTIIHWQ